MFITFNVYFNNKKIINRKKEKENVYLFLFLFLFKL